ncbi:MAG TPA: hypothetical protein VFW73_12205 [Lacipirellulaceae bacterium]|nr:hypothetical protein [Lacipirellulaceae bacterium]
MHPLSEKIVSLQRRLLWRRRAVAICWIAAIAVAAAIVLGLIDYLIHFNDPGLRLMATAAFVAAIIWAVYRWWYLPQPHRLHPLAVARRVETRFPQLSDSLSSALEFLRQSEHDETAGSAQLRRLVITEAQNQIETLDVNEIIERKPLRKAAVALGAALLALSTFLVVDRSSVGIALARLAAPLGSSQWPRQHHLIFRDIPTQLAEGQPFEVKLVDTVGTLPDDVTVEYGEIHNGRREVTSVPMIRVGDAMVAHRDNVTRSFAFRAKGGDDNMMPWHAVQVIKLPQLASLVITAHPPAYSGLPAAHAERHLEVLAGTGIEVAGAATEPIRAARIRLEHGKAIDASIEPDAAGHEGRAFHISPQQWIAMQSGPYKLELENKDGLAGIVGQWSLRVEPDSPPSITWQQPSDDLYVLPRAIVPLEVLVKDDLAIAQVELTYDRNDKSKAERERQPTEPAITLYRGPQNPSDVTQATGSFRRGESRVIKYSWDLEPLHVPAGTILTIQVQARDYRTNVGRTTGPRRISIITPAELEARLADRQLQIARQIERALAIERATREEVHRVEIQLRDGAG